jgi:lysophospholipase L1-like esterase
MDLHISPNVSRLSWHGALGLERGDEWIQPHRLPLASLPYVDPGLRERAEHGAGIRLAFDTDATAISGEIAPIGGEPALYGMKPIDLCIDGEFVGSSDVQAELLFRFDGLRPVMKRVELWLPHLWRFRLCGLKLTDGILMRSSIPPQPRWIVYGSSIEHCAEALSPTRIWPAIVARSANLDLTCLGVGAQCYLDTEVARAIRDTKADLITLRLGINIQIEAALNPRTFSSAIKGFVKIIRERHADTPIMLVSPIIAPLRETESNAAGMSVEDMRTGVRSAFDDLLAYGDTAISYLDGRELFGEGDLAFMPDNLHPNPEGYKLMAERFLQIAPLAQLGEKHT